MQGRGTLADNPDVNREFDVVIVGAGAVGLATALALVQRHRARLLVIDAERAAAAHQTGNNSGVIHSGLYYKPGSLKAQLCARGREMMYRFCAEHGIVHERTGKVVVALDEKELKQLEVLRQRGEANGLRNLRILGMEEVRSHEPHVAGMGGLFVEETGIVDYRQVTRQYARLVQEREGEVRLSAKLVGVSVRGSGMVLETTAGVFGARMLVNCAGLQSDRVARLCGVRPEVQIVPFRGEYYQLRREAHHLVKNLIYPVPNPAFPFLGVHFTRMARGGVEAGPNAVLALARHGYDWRTVSGADLGQTLLYRGFWKMARRYWRTGMGEMHRSFSKKAFHQALARLMPELRIEDLEPGGAGVRAQAVRADGSLVDDFVIQSAPRMVHVLNAPSPAATASLAIGERIAEVVARQAGMMRGWVC